MPDPQELMQLMQGGAPQGGAPLPQGGMPQGGMPSPQGGAMAQALQQKLQQLMQDPIARAGMMQHAQQRGMVPPAAGPNRGEMGPTDRVQPDGGEGAHLYDMMARGRSPEGDMPPGKEQDMVSQEIDRKGATFDGTKAPTANDIERLQAEPTDTMVEAFDAQFGDGAAARYMNEEKGESPRQGGANIEDMINRGRNPDAANYDESKDFEK